MLRLVGSAFMRDVNPHCFLEMSLSGILSRSYWPVSLAGLETSLDVSPRSLFPERLYVVLALALPQLLDRFHQESYLCSVFFVGSFKMMNSVSLT